MEFPGRDLEGVRERRGGEGEREREVEFPGRSNVLFFRRGGKIVDTPNRTSLSCRDSRFHLSFLISSRPRTAMHG